MNIGIDIVENARIKEVYSKHDDKFLEKMFTKLEIDYIKSRNNSIETISGLFSAKESVAKALGKGFGPDVNFHDIEIRHEESGAPYAIYKGMKMSISISNEKDYSISIAISDSGVNFVIPDEIINIVIPRDKYGHKGTFGKTMVIAGSLGMLGAGYLSSNAALKSGCGLVYHYVPDEILDAMSLKQVEVIVKRYTDLMNDYENMDSILVGPGIGIGKANYNKNLAMLKEIIKTDKKVLIDADGLTILAENMDLLEESNADIIMTPHFGEFQRLMGRTISKDEDLLDISINFAKENSCVLVQKGHNTIVTNGSEFYVNHTGNSGMATAGSGDVLSGIISGLLAQGYETFEAAKLGVYIHGLSGDIAAEKKSEHSMVASDILECLGQAFKLII